MDRIIIEGGHRLTGEVQINGAKNSVLPILAATLLADEPSTILGVPDLADVATMVKILLAIGLEVEKHPNQLKVIPRANLVPVAPYELVSTMRAGICVLGPLLAKLGEAKVSLPGGCVIGPRPIDLHLRGLKALGAQIEIVHGYIEARVPVGKRLKGSQVHLAGPAGSSVLATANVMMAAVLAEGETIIESAACEPEIADLANFLVRMGANIEGQGSPTIKIRGVRHLYGAQHSIIPDRIETGTYMIAAAMTHGSILIKNGYWGHITAVAEKLQSAGITVENQEEGIYVKLDPDEPLRSVDITTLSYPGFPTDMQAQMTALMTTAEGVSVITEKIYPDRFIHVAELARMGGHVIPDHGRVIVKGVPKLTGAQVMASDLRASAALVLAGLIAEGQTVVSRIYHLDRGYEHLEEKLTGLGARIWRESEKRVEGTRKLETARI